MKLTQMTRMTKLRLEAT